MENNKSVTAVEWFEQQLDNLDIEIPYIIYAEAKEMEKKQIIDSVNFGQNNYTDTTIEDKEIAEQYYKETFNNE